MRFLVIFIFALLLSNLSYASESGKEMPLDWDTQYKFDGVINLRFLSVKVDNGKLIFNVLAHNLEKERYMCLWAHSADNAIHMDDAQANTYAGGLFLLEPDDNKFGPNQRKKLTISIPKPKEGISTVNIHFGFSVNDTGSSPSSNCGTFVKNADLNFHRLDWDITQLQQ